MRRRTSPLILILFAVFVLGAAGWVVLSGKLPELKGPNKGPTSDSTPIGPKRMPVSGLPNHFIVVYLDGSSYLEYPDGRTEKLTDPGTTPTPEDPLARKSIPKPDPKLEKLIVLEKGVVNIPKNAIITFVGTDRVITHDATGSSVTYFVDGRIENRIKKN